jgi:hypothetical protein
MTEAAHARLLWIERVAADARARGLPTSVAIFLAIRYLNSKSLVAWPSIERLAGDVGADRRNVQRAIQRLVEAGHLLRTVGGGKGKPNTYRLANSGAGDAVSPAQTAALVTPNSGASAAQTAAPAPPDSWKEPWKNPGGTTPRVKPRSSTRAKRRTAIPAGFNLTPEMLAYAESKGWGGNRARDEFERFADHHRQKGNAFADWQAAWRNWVRRGAEFDRQRETGSRNTGLASAAQGLSAWLKRP